MSQTFASLAIPNYRRYATGAIVSNTGTWMQRVAQDWLVLTVLTGLDYLREANKLRNAYLAEHPEERTTR